ncbi:Phospholipase A1-IIdelta [Morus notabilis]|uniref:Phospholipase A1 n=1 Tax=Morus notabilis TaxID=981085 RepID=W9RZ60_9ROSA|nr:phospholipase A1-IIdelta [Morus notabilis]EXC00253.1 Phospholipase A1-IIdelta [Morus notabilis]
METNTNNASTQVAAYKLGNTSSSPTWEEIRGSNNWKDLLEPLNLELREFILRCGDFCEATYDAYMKESMNFPESSFFNDVMLQNAPDYQVRYFLYAPSGSNIIGVQSTKSEINSTHWIGYVAVTTDDVSKKTGRREIYVVWRGTDNVGEWITNLFGALHSKPLGGSLIESGNKEVTVHGGWLEMYTDEKVVTGGISVRKQLHNAIQELKQEYEGREEKLSLVITGHSLGGALATLSAFDLVENKIIGDHIPGVSAIVFSCPNVGNEAFRKRVLETHSKQIKILHVKNVRDIVPRVPFVLLAPHKFVTTSTSELEVDTWKSPYLETSQEQHKFQSKGVIENILNVIEHLPYLIEGAIDQHNLEALLHVVAWWNGKDKEFDKTPKVRRSLALVNKWSNYLKDELRVPARWWEEKDKKGMVPVLEWVPKDQWPEWANIFLILPKPN